MTNFLCLLSHTLLVSKLQLSSASIVSLAPSPSGAAQYYNLGECNYGGRVTDGQDRRCLMSMLGMYYSISCVEDDNYKFSDSGEYFAPPHGEYESYINYIKSLPIDPLPEVFGLHENADIARQQAETQLLFDSVLITLPRASGGAGDSPQDVVERMAADLLQKIPGVFDNLAVAKVGFQIEQLISFLLVSQSE